MTKDPVSIPDVPTEEGGECPGCGTPLTKGREYVAQGKAGCCPDMPGGSSYVEMDGVKSHPRPTQAQDVAGLVEGDWVSALSDEYDRLPKGEWYGHMDHYFVGLSPSPVPGEGKMALCATGDHAAALTHAIAILLHHTPEILARFRPSPISHETKGLVLAAADNNREALVSALERVQHNFNLLLSGKPVRDVAETEAEVRQALAAFQSRQEGKQPEAEAEEDRRRAEDDDLMPGGFQ